MDLLRVGRISSINAEKGKCRVVYSDRDNCTTIELPLIVYNNEYYVPEVDDQVLVLHQPNGSVSGFILGDFWSETHKTPEHTGEKYRRKDFDRNGKCYWQYCGDDDGTWELHNDDDIIIKTQKKIDLSSEKDFSIESKSGKVIIKGKTEVTVNSDGSVTINGGDVEIQGSNVDIQGGNVTLDGNVNIAGVNFLLHTHECTAPGAASGPVNPI